MKRVARKLQALLSTLLPITYETFTQYTIITYNNIKTIRCRILCINVCKLAQPSGQQTWSVEEASAAIPCGNYNA
jgi:hypothetical protein